MLKVFRNKNVAKMVLWGIVILIMPAFVLWGTGSLGRSGAKGPTYAGLIDGRKVSFDRFGHSIVGVKCQVILNFYRQPKLLDDILNNRELLGKMAWDRLIMEREAKKAGIKVANEEVVKFITTHPIFVRDGQFDTRIYDYVLKRVPIDPRSFEEIVRENVTIQRLHDSLTKEASVTDEEALEAYRRENDRLKLSYVIFTPEAFAGKAAVDEALIKEYYDSNKAKFAIPPKRLEDGSISEGGTAKFEEVRDDIKAFLTAIEARKLAIKAADEEHAKIKDLMAKGNATFESAVEAEGLKRAETSFFTRNEYVEGIGEAFPLTDEAVKLEPGGISPPVETRGGAVIFRVSEVQKSDEEKFKKEKEEYSKRVLEAKKMAVIDKWIRQLELSNPAVIDFRDYEKYYR